MGRKRKTRWRRLSIGGNSGNEEEEAERESEILGFSKMNPSSRTRSGSTPAIVNSYDHSSSPTPLPAMNGTTNHSSSGGGGKYGGHQSPTESNPKSILSDENGQSGTIVNGGGGGGVNGYGSSKDNHSANPNNSYNPRGEHHYSSNGYSNYHSERKEPRRTGEGEGNYNGSTNNGYYPSSNYYHHHHRNNSSYNNHQSGSYRGYEGSGGGGYRGRGGGDYHHSSRFGGRFRKPRPYSSNYYYNNGSTTSSAGSNEDGTPNRPSYNQEEYTKITTPRQDVLFKKGYLSQRKPVTQSSSVDSTSGPTTPSTNGTPDTHSTNGINSDYSEGYENGETELGVLPYDDTVYYGPPPETAVFTDPNTGQVYYGQSNGEYFDAYPVMMGGYPAPVYYHVPYPAGLDWNGLPTPIYPLVPLGPPPLDDHQTVIQSGELQKCDGTTSGGGGGKKSDSSGPTPVLTNGTLKNSKGGSKKSTGSGGSGGEGGMNGTLSDSSTSSREGSSSTFSSAASTPMSPLVNGHLGALTTSMSSMHLGDGHQPQLQPHHHHPQHQPIHPGIPVSHYMGPPPPPHHHHPHHHPQQILYHPHPATFVYAPPIYNGVVVPIAPAASTAESQSSPIPNSRKKRKLRRRKKDDDGQLTDESSPDEETIEEEPKEQSIPPPSNSTNPLDPLTPTTSEPTTSSETSPSKSSNSGSVARKKDLIAEEPSCPPPPSPPPPQTPTPSDPQSQIRSNGSLENKIESKSQIPLVEGDEVVKPEENRTAEEEEEGVDQEVNKEIGAPPEIPQESPAEQPLPPIRKPQDLTLGILISTDEDSVLLPLKSPLGEPSSPDSFNTTQSVAGSEVPSVSISETDFMNRTTSVDEVEEDLPVEYVLLESTPPAHPQRSTIPELKSRSFEEVPEEDPSSRGPQQLSSQALPIQPPPPPPDSPIPSPTDPAEPSPSPETLFERQLELPVLPALNVETLNFIHPQPLERTGLVCEEIAERVDAIGVDSSPLLPGGPYTSATVPLSPASDDVVHSVCITQEPEIQEPNIREENPVERSRIIERPHSITLAVAEWLKVQGSDALTPVNQLRDIFEEDGGESGTEEDDESEEEDHLTTEDLAHLDPTTTTTTTTSGLPDKSASPSNCAIQ